MPRLLPTAFAFMLCLACTSKPADRRQSTLSFHRDSGGDTTPVLVNQRWLAAPLAFESDSWLILLERDSAKWCGGEIQWCHSLALSAWIGARDTDRPADWTASVDAAPGDFDSPSYPRFYRAVHSGCCDVRDAFELFSVRNGASAFRSSLPLIEVRISGQRDTRYIGFLDTWSALEPREQSSSRRLGGILQYGSPDAPVDRAILQDADSSRHCCRIEKVELLWKRTRTTHGLTLDSPTGFTIRLELLPDYDADLLVVEVPVLNDRLDLTRAVLPPGITIRR